MSLNLKINKPLVFIKVDTTGLRPVLKRGDNTPADRIVSLSMVRYNLDGTRSSGSMLINPMINIPFEASNIHGINNDTIVNEPTFGQVANDILEFIGDSDFSGFNISKFDLIFLVEEFGRVGIEFQVFGRKIFDLMDIFHKVEPRSFKMAASKFAGLNVGKVSSEQSADISVSILNGMLDNSFAENVINNISVSKNIDINGNLLLTSDNKVVFNFGKYKGFIVSDMLSNDTTYYDWCINTNTLPCDTKFMIKRVFEKHKKTSTQNV